MVLKSKLGGPRGIQFARQPARLSPAAATPGSHYRLTLLRRIVRFFTVKDY